MHFSTIMDGFDNEDEQVASFEGSNAQVLHEDVSVQKVKVNQRDLIDQLQVAYFGLINQNVLLQEITLQLHATIQSSQDLVSEMHHRLEEKDKCILGLRRFNLDLVRQVSELSGISEDCISEDCIRKLQISASSVASISASTPTLVGASKLYSPDNGDSKVRDTEDMLQEVTQPISQVNPSFSSSSHVLMASLGPSLSNIGQCT